MKMGILKLSATLFSILIILGALNYLNIFKIFPYTHQSSSNQDISTESLPSSQATLVPSDVKLLQKTTYTQQEIDTITTVMINNLTVLSFLIQNDKILAESNPREYQSIKNSVQWSLSQLIQQEHFMQKEENTGVAPDEAQNIFMLKSYSVYLLQTITSIAIADIKTVIEKSTAIIASANQLEIILKAQGKETQSLQLLLADMNKEIALLQVKSSLYNEILIKRSPRDKYIEENFLHFQQDIPALQQEIIALQINAASISALSIK